MKDFNSAVVFGKFWPLHLGHTALIADAVARSLRTLVFVNDGMEDVPATVRIGWVKEEFPDADVRSCPDLCGHDTSECTPFCSKRYASWLIENFGRVDAVFSGESYGDLLSLELGATSMRRPRDLSISGRKIRANLVGGWNLMSPPARAWYCRRVVVVGAESTGTTTLAQDLAASLSTDWVPEFGREFTEAHGLDHHWVTADFEFIAESQISMEENAARHSGPVLICDTDALATAIWHERYVGGSSRQVMNAADNHRPHLYILTCDDIPFDQDGFRDGEHIRNWMTSRFREVLKESGVPWIEVSGTRDERVSQSAEAIREFCGTEWMSTS